MANSTVSRPELAQAMGITLDLVLKLMKFSHASIDEKAKLDAEVDQAFAVFRAKFEELSGTSLESLGE